MHVVRMVQVSHARGPDGACIHVCMSTVDRQAGMDRHTIFAFVTRDPLPIST